MLFAPQVLSGIAIGIIWRWIYEPSDGPINRALDRGRAARLREAVARRLHVALPAVGVVGMWATMGFCMVLFLAGVQKIPQSLYDAARVDGAGWWREFFAASRCRASATSSLVALTITLIVSLRNFDIVYVTTQGGPGEETTVPSLRDLPPRVPVRLRRHGAALGGHARLRSSSCSSFVITPHRGARPVTSQARAAASATRCWSLFCIVLARPDRRRSSSTALSGPARVGSLDWTALELLRPRGTPGSSRRTLRLELIVAVGATLLCLDAARSSPGYAFGCMRFRGSTVLFYVILLGLMVPVEAMLDARSTSTSATLSR